MSRTPPGFDFSAAMRAACVDAVARLDEFVHVDMDRIAVGVCQARNRSHYGVYASLTPLRFSGGAATRVIRGRPMRIQRLVDATASHEFLYLLNFYLPRFQSLPLDEKLTTIVHELWHVSPQFNGDVRRHAGRCYAHGRSKRQYDDEMAALARRWLLPEQVAQRFPFLAKSFAELESEYGGVCGQRWNVPKLAPAP